MSYGYQGPSVMPFPGQKPPNSFGLGPGTPTPPSAPPQSETPTSFGMPQSYSPYPNTMPNAHILQSSPYSTISRPSMPLPQHQPSMPQPSIPQPSIPQHFMPQPSSIPYPGQNIIPSQPYAPQDFPSHQQPYSQQVQQQPFSMQSHQSYPTYPVQQINQQPYPLQPQQPFSSPSVSQGQPQSYQSHGFPSYQGHVIPQNFNNTSSNASLYPNLSSLENPDLVTPAMHNSSSSPYPGGGYSGGRVGSFTYGGLASYCAPAPRKTPAKLSPTVVAYNNFDPRADAEVLRKAMKGFGTDEKSIIQVLANRSNLQRQEIERQFKTLYGKELIKDLKSETSGNFEKLLVAMMTPLPQYYAKELHDAMSGVGTEEHVLIEVLCTMSNHEIRVIKQAYEAMFGKSLEDDLREDTSGCFERLMVSLCCANRDESFNVDLAAAANDARQLLQAGELRFGTDESTFNAILVQRNTAQLQQIFAEYQNITGHDIENAVENEFSGDIKKGLLAIVKCVKNRPGFFAEQLYKSMKGMGTQDRRLMRIIITRSEIDMGEIKQAFMHQYGQSLENFISDDCSGHYKKCLLALIS